MSDRLQSSATSNRRFVNDSAGGNEMDIRTGETYETREAALAAGVPESDIAEVTADGPKFKRMPVQAAVNPKHPIRHQNTREMERRLRQAASK